MSAAQKGRTYRQYERLVKEMKQKKLKHRDIAELLGVSVYSVGRKLAGTAGNGHALHFSLEQACAIQERYFPEISVNELFKTKKYTL